MRKHILINNLVFLINFLLLTHKNQNPYTDTPRYVYFTRQ